MPIIFPQSLFNSDQIKKWVCLLGIFSLSVNFLFAQNAVIQNKNIRYTIDKLGKNLEFTDKKTGIRGIGYQVNQRCFNSAFG